MTDLMRRITRRVQLPRGPVSVTLYPGAMIGFREKGRRTEYVLPLARVFVMAADAHQQQKKAERARRRRGEA